jgi:hypothetical protein
MTQPVIISVLDSTQTYEITQLLFDSGSDGTATSAVEIYAYNAGTVDAATLRLNAIRCDFVRATPAGEESADTNANGGEVVSEAWIEAKLLAGDAWTPIDEYANHLDLGALAAAGVVKVYVRLNVASGASTVGETDFALAFRATTA